VRAPKVGFVSLGCPKALVDAERILTQLRAEGYATAGDYAGADLVIVNTCGFIDAAVEESLGAIGAFPALPSMPNRQCHPVVLRHLPHHGQLSRLQRCA
jgi:tRNA A37 methylthiotransferase MiaB